MTIAKRWVFLLFSCLTFFSAEFVVDQTSVIVARLSGTAAACTNGEDAACKNFSASQFNGLYVAHFWAGGCTALFTGFFIAKFGVYIMSVASGALLLIGMLFFTLGPYVSSSDGAFALMVTGRVIFAIGYFGNIVISHQVKAHWFFGKEMALSFTLYIISSRAGAIVTYAVVGSLLEIIGLQNTLWVVFCIGFISPVSSSLAGWVYQRYASESIHADLLHQYDKESATALFDVSKIRRLGREYWTIAGIIFFYFGALFTLLADFPKFLTEYYLYSESMAGQIAGAIPDVAIIAPIFGLTIDKFGFRDIHTFSATLLFFVGFLVLSAVPRMINPVVPAVLVALSYGVTTASIWSSIPVVTLPSVVGVAMGIGVGTEALSAGLWLLITGFLLDESNMSATSKWSCFFAIMAVIAGLSWVLSGISIYFDYKNDLRPLRVQHTLPAMCAELNVEVDECTSLVNNKVND